MLPASAERFIELDETLIFIAPNLRERQFGLEERPLPIQHLEIGRNSSLVARNGEADGLLQVCNGNLLENPDLMEFLVANQRIGHITKGLLDGLLVSNQGLLVKRFG